MPRTPQVNDSFVYIDPNAFKEALVLTLTRYYEFTHAIKRNWEAEQSAREKSRITPNEKDDILVTQRVYDDPTYNSESDNEDDFDSTDTSASESDEPPSASINTARQYGPPIVNSYSQASAATAPLLRNLQADEITPLLESQPGQPSSSQFRSLFVSNSQASAATAPLGESRGATTDSDLDLDFTLIGNAVSARASHKYIIISGYVEPSYKNFLKRNVALPWDGPTAVASYTLGFASFLIELFKLDENDDLKSLMIILISGLLINLFYNVLSEVLNKLVSTCLHGLTNEDASVVQNIKLFFIARKDTMRFSIQTHAPTSVSRALTMTFVMWGHALAKKNAISYDSLSGSHNLQNYSFPLYEFLFALCIIFLMNIQARANHGLLHMPRYFIADAAYRTLPIVMVAIVYELMNNLHYLNTGSPTFNSFLESFIFSTCCALAFSLTTFICANMDYLTQNTFNLFAKHSPTFEKWFASIFTDIAIVDTRRELSSNRDVIRLTTKDLDAHPRKPPEPSEPSAQAAPA